MPHIFRPAWIQEWEQRVFGAINFDRIVKKNRVFFQWLGKEINKDDCVLVNVEWLSKGVKNDWLSIPIKKINS